MCGLLVIVYTMTNKQLPPLGLHQHSFMAAQ